MGSGRIGLAALPLICRGYGESTVVSGKITLDIFARDLDALLETLGIAEPVVMCGPSMGGQIVMEFCRLFPHRVSGLVLVATFPRAESPDSDPANRNGFEHLVDDVQLHELVQALLAKPTEMTFVS